MDERSPSARAWLWILAPLLLALLYAAAFPLFAPDPTLSDLPPSDAVLTHRFKDLATMDAAWFRHPDDESRPSEREAARRNLGGLPGVDSERPFHLVLLRRAQRPDPTMLILPIADEDALRERFEDPTFFLEKGYIRHAQHLGIRGSWAAIGGDRGVVRHLGGGGITARDLGEDHAIAVDVGAMIRFMLAAPLEPPWRQILEALGFAPSRTGATEEVEGAALLIADRLFRVHDAWRTARLWSWQEAGRIRADLEPRADSVLAKRLAAISTDAARTVPDAPPRAQAWIRLSDGVRRAAFAHALYGAGIPFPADLATGDDEPKPLGAWGESAGDGVLLWAAPSTGTGYAWTLGVAAPGPLPPLAPFHPAVPEEVGDAEAAAGTLPLTLADLQLDRTSPAGRILRRAASDLDIVVLGPAAEEAWRRFETWLARGESRRSPLPAPPAGWHVVATFGLVEARARSILGDELKRGGLLAALAGGDIEGRVLTDGVTLRLEAQVARK